MLGVVEVAFDPVARLGPLVIRWQTLVLAVAILCSLLVAARLVLRAPVPDGRRPLRLDDLVFVVLGAVPGAVIGARLVHGLAYLDHYRMDPASLLDPARGGLSLSGAILGGTLTAWYIARLLDGSARRWADVAAVPFLLAVALGKVAQFVGGGGQGASFGGDWAVSFQGAGPWASAAPAVAAHPSQLYEAAWVLLGVLVVALSTRSGLGRSTGWTPGVLRRGRRDRASLGLAGADATVAVPSRRSDLPLIVGRLRSVALVSRSRPDAAVSRSAALEQRLQEVATRFSALQRGRPPDGPVAEAPAQSSRPSVPASGGVDVERRQQPGASAADAGGEERQGAGPFGVALSWWLAGRFLVGFTWADDAMVGPLSMEQAVAGTALVAIALAGTIRSASPSRRRAPASA